jgi:hypothetical protein
MYDRCRPQTDKYERELNMWPVYATDDITFMCCLYSILYFRTSNRFSFNVFAIIALCIVQQTPPSSDRCWSHDTLAVFSQKKSSSNRTIFCFPNAVTTSLTCRVYFASFFDRLCGLVCIFVRLVN